MELKQLQYFYEVCRCRSFSEAAKNLYVTQQGISKAVSMLEKELNVELLIRGRQGIRPTAQGQYLKERCEFLLDYAEDTKKNIQKIGVFPVENLRVSLTSGGRIIIPMSMTEEFERENPDIGISVLERNEYECEKDVWERRSDGAIMTVPQKEGRYRVYPLTQESVCVMMHKSHPLAGCISLRHEDLQELDLILLRELSRTNEQLLSCLKKEQIRVNIRYRVPNLLSAMELCGENRGCVILVEKLKHKLRYPDLVFLPVELPGMRWNLCFITARDQEKNPRLEAFVTFLQSRLQPLL